MGETSFYASLLVIVKFLMGGISVEECIKSLLAPVYGIYWFPTAYIGMYLVFPFMNIVIEKVKEKIDRIFVLFNVVFCLTNFLFVSSNFLYSDLACFIYLYFVAAWNKYSKIQHKKYSAQIAIASVTCIWVSSIVLNLGCVSKVESVTVSK